MVSKLTEETVESPLASIAVMVAVYTVLVDSGAVTIKLAGGPEIIKPFAVVIVFIKLEPPRGVTFSNTFMFVTVTEELTLKARELVA